MKFKKKILSKNPRLKQERKHRHSTVSASLVTVSIVIEIQKLNSDSTQGCDLIHMDENRELHKRNKRIGRKESQLSLYATARVYNITDTNFETRKTRMCRLLKNMEANQRTT